ncbi:hypothetical protein Arth_0984 [Arthrobacter sp. FB24]|nr:hypothetical protein Arth_0984 [Arthrobacter sp. FB24]
MSAPNDFLTRPDTIGLAVCERWKDVGEEADLVSWSSVVAQLGLNDLTHRGIAQAVLVRHALRVECVLTPAPNWDEVYRGVNELLDKGWDVTVLAPLGSLGTAHEALSGLAAVLQGWWVRDDQRLHFSTEEIA